LHRFRNPVLSGAGRFRRRMPAEFIRRHRPGKRSLIAWLALPAILWFLFSSPGLCQESEVAVDPKASLSELNRSIEETVDIEQAKLERYRGQLKNLQDIKISLATAANAYQIQLSIYGNLLLSSNPELEDLEKAWSDIRTSLTDLQKQLGEMMPKKENVEAELTNNRQQQELLERQIAEISKFPKADSEARAFLKKAKTLRGLLAEKATVLEKLQELYNYRISQMENIRRSFTELSNKFEQQVEESRTSKLFDRRKSPLSLQAWTFLVEEGKRLAEKIRVLFQPEFWAAEAAQLWRGAGLVLISFAVLMAVFVGLLVRLHRGLVSLEAHPVRERLGAWHLLALRLVNRSLLLTGLTAFVYLCSLLDVFYLSTPSIRLAAHLLLAALLTRWARIALSFWKEEGRLTPESEARMRRLVKAIRYFTWANLVLHWALGSGAGLWLILRLVFLLWLLGWQISFWRFLETRERTAQLTANIGRVRYLMTPAKPMGYLIVGVALLLEMVGYNALSLHWMLSWGRSLVVALWWGVAYFMLREWDAYYRQKRAAERNELIHDEYPIQWLMIRIAQLMWLLSIVVALILAWGGRQVVLARIYQGLGHSVQIGSMTFSFLGLLYAVLVLLATRAVVRLWRWVFQTKFLTRSGMDVGLQDSITTISVYIIWMLGILVALHVFGLNTASLAVAFGALGIGLGFGLQNIFNNFVSGIILLFERPIQVGDDVEINGTWATVKKINVRSTVVQTYDNASLIIPNADFVSTQVTNWSFKDKRLRRSITVGVAYGSNVTLVRDTLLEIARNMPKVLKYPAPDVLFTDFGDSALIFRLRIWTDIDNMLKVETAIRFEIDRLFKERGIEISFPQRDIHIRSWVPEARGQVGQAAAAKDEAPKAGKPDGNEGAQ